MSDKRKDECGGCGHMVDQSKSHISVSGTLYCNNVCYAKKVDGESSAKQQLISDSSTFVGDDALVQHAA